MISSSCLLFEVFFSSLLLLSESGFDWVMLVGRLLNSTLCQLSYLYKHLIHIMKKYFKQPQLQLKFFTFKRRSSQFFCDHCSSSSFSSFFSSSSSLVDSIKKRQQEFKTIKKNLFNYLYKEITRNTTVNT